MPEPEVFVEADPKDAGPGERVKVHVSVRPWDKGLEYHIEEWDVDEGEIAGTPPDVINRRRKRATATWIAPQTEGEHAVTVTVSAVSLKDDEETEVWRESGSDEIEVSGAYKGVQFSLIDCPDDTITAMAGDTVCVMADIPDAPEEVVVVDADVSHGRVSRIERVEHENAKFRMFVQLDDDMTPGDHTFEIQADFAPRPPEPQAPLPPGSDAKKLKEKKAGRKEQTATQAT